MSALRNALPLAAAAALASWTPLAGIRARGWFREAAVVGRLDGSLAELRLGLVPGERIGIVVPLEAESETEYWYAAQYALAPAVVQPILIRDCAAAEPGPSCRPGGTSRAAALRADPTTIALLERRLGLVPVGSAGRALLLGTAER